ncbi:MAG: hypothetical protein EXR77_11595 [Myxococcales bacterium]|nr:hypothetical protein [Myxococcales bacterium]
MPVVTQINPVVTQINPVPTLIKGVTLWSAVADEGPLATAELLVVGDKIKCIGVTVADPAAKDPRARKSCSAQAGAAVVRDFGGLATVTPGFIESLARIGQVEIELEDGTHDGVARRASNFAHIRAIDGIVTHSRTVEAARKGGVTTTLARPQGNALVVGQSAAFRTQAKLIDAALVRDAVAIHVNLGDHAKNGEPYVGARSGQLALLREILGQATRLNSADPKKKLSPAEAQSLQRLRDDSALAALAGLLKAGRPLVAHVDRADDIAALLRLKRELPFRLVIAGGAEAHVIAAELSAAKVPVILSPVRAKPYDPDNRRASDAAAAILAKAGVVVGLATADTYNARNLRWDAGFAIAHGLERSLALAAISRTIAVVFDLAAGSRPVTGTIIEGGPADLLVFDGDPLGLTGRLRLVATAGEIELDPQQR